MGSRREGRWTGCSPAAWPSTPSQAPRLASPSQTSALKTWTWYAYPMYYIYTYTYSIYNGILSTDTCRLACVLAVVQCPLTLMPACMHLLPWLPAATQGAAEHMCTEPLCNIVACIVPCLVTASATKINLIKGFLQIHFPVYILKPTLLCSQRSAAHCPAGYLQA